MSSMQTQFVTVDDVRALDEWLERSQNNAVVLFKHSTTCPISAAAYAEMKRLAVEVGLVVVQRARDVSREVETRTGVRHESPQAFVLRDKQVVWSASHWEVTADAVAAALREYGAVAAGG